MSIHPGAPARPAPDARPAIGDAWEHREELVAYSRRLLGAYAELAEDVVQEAYLRLHERAARGAPVEEARPWLFRVARNLALDERRRGRRGDDVLSSLEVVSPGPRGPLELLQQREEARQALEGLDALPPRERRTMILEQAGLTPPAIARRMHTTTNAVHQSLFRARRRMRDARAAALGLLPLPLVRLAVRATGSPALDRLPALAPGSGGRFGGGAGLAGLVAATVIGGGVVADRPVVPSPPVPARAAAVPPAAPSGPAAATPAAVVVGPAGRAPGAARRATRVPAVSRAALVPGVREAPARLAVRDAGLSRGDDGPPHGGRAASDDGEVRGDEGHQGRRSRGDDDGRGERRRSGDGARHQGRRSRGDGGGRDDDAGRRSRGDGGGRDDDAGRRGRGGDRGGDGPALGGAAAAPPVIPAPDPDPSPPAEGPVTAPGPSPDVPGPEEPVPGTPIPDAGGGGAEGAPPMAGMPPGDPDGPS